MARTQSHVKNAINLTWRSKVNIVLGSWMYPTHFLMEIDLSQISYANVMANRSYTYGSDTNKFQNSINLTLRSKSKSYRDHERMQHNLSWWYTQVPNMVNQCQTKKSFWPDTNLYRRQTDGRTDIQQSDSYLPLNFVRRGPLNLKTLKKIAVQLTCYNQI